MLIRFLLKAAGQIEMIDNVKLSLVMLNPDLSFFLKKKHCWLLIKPSDWNPQHFLLCLQMHVHAYNWNAAG